jgi:hypothetical protein
MPDRINTESCVHTLLENGIQEFVFYESSRNAVDKLFILLTQVYAEIPADQTVLMLFDFRQRDLPLAYVFSSFHRWQAGRDSHRYARLVTLTDANMMIPLVDAFFRSFPTNYVKLRFFHPARRDEAIHWLLKDE